MALRRPYNRCNPDFSDLTANAPADAPDLSEINPDKLNANTFEIPTAPFLQPFALGADAPFFDPCTYADEAAFLSAGYADDSQGNFQSGNVALSFSGGVLSVAGDGSHEAGSITLPIEFATPITGAIGVRVRTRTLRVGTRAGWVRFDVISLLDYQGVKWLDPDGLGTTGALLAVAAAEAPAAPAVADTDGTWRETILLVHRQSAAATAARLFTGPVGGPYTLRASVDGAAVENPPNTLEVTIYIPVGELDPDTEEYLPGVSIDFAGPVIRTGATLADIAAAFGVTLPA